LSQTASLSPLLAEGKRGKGAKRRAGQELKEGFDRSLATTVGTLLIMTK
jgi:hypothetical protein